MAIDYDGEYNWWLIAKFAKKSTKLNKSENYVGKLINYYFKGERPMNIMVQFRRIETNVQVNYYSIWCVNWCSIYQHNGV